MRHPKGKILPSKWRPTRAWDLVNLGSQLDGEKNNAVVKCDSASAQKRSTGRLLCRSEHFAPIVTVWMFLSANGLWTGLFAAVVSEIQPSSSQALVISPALSLWPLII